MSPHESPHLRTRTLTARRVAAATAGLALVAGALIAAPANAAPPRPVDPLEPDFGANVDIFSPDTPVADIEERLEEIASKQVDNEMGTERYGVYFLPGDYGTAEDPLQFEVGYYTEVAGLGAAPGDVILNGAAEVYNRCLGDGGTSNCIALNNFWRTLSNLSIQVDKAGQDGCRQGTNFWAVSQAVSMRRVEVTGGNLSLMDYCGAGPQ